MGNSVNEIIIWQSREKLKRILISSVVMVAVSIVCFFFEGSFYKAAAAAGTCFFGIALVYTLSLYVRPKKLLVLSQEGIRDCQVFCDLGVIPWDHILDVQIVEYNERKYLSLKCRDMEEKIRLLSGGQQKRVYQNLKNHMEPVSIMIDMADRKPEEIRILIVNKL